MTLHLWIAITIVVVVTLSLFSIGYYQKYKLEHLRYVTLKKENLGNKKEEQGINSIIANLLINKPVGVYEVDGRVLIKKTINIKESGVSSRVRLNKERESKRVILQGKLGYLLDEDYYILHEDLLEAFSSKDKIEYINKKAKLIK